MSGNIYLTGAVRGLVAEGERVVSIMQKVTPNIVALSISKEGLTGLTQITDIEESDTKPANIEEEIYMRGLAEFGEVIRPPPCFSMAVKDALKTGTPIKALDMDDVHYTAAYCKYVSTMDMMRQGRSEKRFTKYLFLSETPQDFVMEWDELVNRLAGYRDLENAREEWLAKGLSRLSLKHSKILAIVELERLAGLERHLKSLKCDFEIVQ